MKRLRLLILVFGLALAVPLSYVVVRTFHSLKQEEVAELRFFGEALFDRMQEDLAGLVRREEARSVDAYLPDADETSPLSRMPQEDFVVGWFQSGPDGEFQTPMAASGTGAEMEQRIRELRETHAALARTLATPPDGRPEPEPPSFTELKQEQQLTDRYFAETKTSKRKQVLGQEEERFERISPEQAMRLSPSAPPPQAASPVPDDFDAAWSDLGATQIPGETSADTGRAAQTAEAESRAWQAEIAPLQAVTVDREHAVLFRRVVVGNRVLRQGLVVRTQNLLDHLMGTHYAGHPMSRFTSLTLQAADQTALDSGVSIQDPKYRLERVFPRPFSFIRATLLCSDPPASTGRTLLTLMVAVLAVVVLLGLLAIDRSVRVVAETSRRRAGFVSSVTHELKTPLTNIRLYAEMLEQGMARDREHEEEYLRIIGSESKRLSRLIANVLEFSKLERRQRPMNMEHGTLDEVLAEVRDIMGPKINQEGFTLSIDKQDIPPFAYDREAMTQVLINLVDNSLKFARGAATREIRITVSSESAQVLVKVADSGPGIPKKDLERIFDDFYRVENDLTRQTKGTGIGLALVRRFVTAMRGTIVARNNPEGGCTFTMTFPAGKG